ncbi:hypothetical protein Fcan01_23755 [Folsomia candida]|uniref:Uncharacterized protein n=1 Tax=Folsomia candida TaxID=158441 RepID=A0A226D9F4_FOLCA|nr:hypothetical protein Fcan01_23755 [Folsomia candida]
MAGRVSFAAFVAIMLLPPCWTSPADSSVWVGPSAVIREIEDARVYSDKQEILFLIPDLPDAPKLRVVPCRAQDNPICDLLIPMNKAVVQLESNSGWRIVVRAALPNSWKYFLDIPNLESELVSTEKTAGNMISEAVGSLHGFPRSTSSTDHAVSECRNGLLPLGFVPPAALEGRLEEIKEKLQRSSDEEMEW